MFSNLSQKIVCFLLNKNAIQSDSQEIYQFGIEQLLTTALNLITVIFLGVLFGEIYQSILFVAAFMILRSYAGGYHASTPVRCYLMSAFAIVAGLSVMKFINFNDFVCIGLLVLSGIIILLLAPVGTANKPLDDIEHIVYRRKAILVWCVETCAVLALMLFGVNEISECIILAQALVCIALIFGQIQCNKAKKAF